MNHRSGRLGWLRRLLDRLGRGRIIAEQPIRMIVSRTDEGDEEEEGPGVPVPVGPRPRRGGAGAQPPRPEEPQEPRR